MSLKPNTHSFYLNFPGINNSCTNYVKLQKLILEGNLDVLSEVAIIQIIEILNVHHKHEKLVKSGMMALASIVTLDG